MLKETLKSIISPDLIPANLIPVLETESENAYFENETILGNEYKLQLSPEPEHWIEVHEVHDQSNTDPRMCISIDVDQSNILMTLNPNSTTGSSQELVYVLNQEANTFETNQATESIDNLSTEYPASEVFNLISQVIQRANDLDRIIVSLVNKANGIILPGLVEDSTAKAFLT